MNAQQKLNLVGVCTNILTKGDDEQVQMFAGYVDLGNQALLALDKQRQTIAKMKADVIAKQKESEKEIEKSEVEEEVKFDKEMAKETPKKPVQTKKVVKSVPKEKVKEVEPVSEGKTDVKVN